MSEILSASVDKFTFIVPTDRLYNQEGLWVQAERDGIVRVGLGDFLQQHSGDVAFAEVAPAGTLLEAGRRFASVETIKANLELESPVPGTVIEVNPALASRPEVINQDPYGGGWLARVMVEDWPAVRDRLLDPRRYFDVMQERAASEARTS